jgi:hypothetical protein
MIRLLVATIALVTVFSMPALAALTGPGSAPRVRDIPDLSRKKESNAEDHQVQSTEKRSQTSEGIGEFNDCHFSGSHDLDCE